MTESAAIAQSKRPVTGERLLASFRKLGVEQGDVLLVHSSLSSLGWVCGGAVTVVEALERAVGARGTLVMPAHSGGLSEPSNWTNPPVPASWWSEIRQTMPAFDAARTPTLMMGAIAELFRTLPGVLRSNHPTTSMAASGFHAELIARMHPLEDSLGEESPLATVYALDGKVLLLGVGHDTNTSLHLGERKAFGDRQRRVRTGSPLLVDGSRRWVEYEEPLAANDDFEQLGHEFEMQPDNVTISGACRLMSQRKLVDFAATWLADHREADGVARIRGQR